MGSLSTNKTLSVGSSQCYINTGIVQNPVTLFYSGQIHDQTCGLCYCYSNFLFCGKIAVAVTANHCWSEKALQFSIAHVSWLFISNMKTICSNLKDFNKKRKMETGPHLHFHPPSLLTVLPSHPRVVTCNCNHVTHNPLCLIFGGLLPAKGQPLCSSSFLFSIFCHLLIPLHQLTFKVNHSPYSDLASPCVSPLKMLSVADFWSLGEPRSRVWQGLEETAAILVNMVGVECVQVHE